MPRPTRRPTRPLGAATHRGPAAPATVRGRRPRSAIATLAATTALLAAGAGTAGADQRRSVEAEHLAPPVAVVVDGSASGGEALRQSVGRRTRTRPTDLVPTSALRVRIGGCTGRVRLGSSTRPLQTFALVEGWQVVVLPADPGSTSSAVRFARAPGRGACRQVLVDRVDVTAPALPLGAAIEGALLRDDARYRAAYASTFDGMTPENAMKMDRARPSEERYEFDEADALVGGSAAARRPVRGHALVFDRQLPGWLANPLLPWTRERLLRVLQDHITTNVTRYRGRVGRWDVVNEAIDLAGRPKASVWQQRIGGDYIDLAFRFARAADPGARLVYNEDGIERANARQDGVARMLQGLIARGVPVDGVGVQAHVDPAAPPTEQELDATFSRFADLGLKVELTEVDVPLGGLATPERIAAQTETYRRLAAACWRHVACDRMTVWGVTDASSWRGALASATLIDASYRPKPALEAVRRALRGEF